MLNVFISSTYEDLKDYIKKLTDSLQQLKNIIPRNMKFFSARPDHPKKVCFEEIEKSDLFIGIYAHSYGHIPEGDEKSITEQEYDYGKKLGIERYCFLIEETQPWNPKLIEDYPNKEKLIKFKRRLSKEIYYNNFTSPEDLNSKVIISIIKRILESTTPIKDISKELYEYWNYLFSQDRNPLNAYRQLNKWRENTNLQVIVDQLVEDFEKEVEFSKDPKYQAIRLRLKRYNPKKHIDYFRLLEHKVKYELSEMRIQEVDEALRGLRDYYINVDNTLIEKVLNKVESYFIDKYQKIVIDKEDFEQDPYQIIFIGSMSYTLGKIWFLKDNLIKAKEYFNKSIDLRNMQREIDFHGIAYQHKEIAKIEYFLPNKNDSQDLILNHLNLASQFADKANDTRINLTILAWSLILLNPDIEFLNLNYNSRKEELNSLLTYNSSYPVPDVAECKAISKFCLGNHKNFDFFEKQTMMYHIFAKMSGIDTALPDWVKISDKFKQFII